MLSLSTKPVFKFVIYHYFLRERKKFIFNLFIYSFFLRTDEIFYEMRTIRLHNY